jgi:hypothetical protein
MIFWSQRAERHQRLPHLRMADPVSCRRCGRQRSAFDAAGRGGQRATLSVHACKLGSSDLSMELAHLSGETPGNPGLSTARDMANFDYSNQEVRTEEKPRSGPVAL